MEPYSLVPSLDTVPIETNHYGMSTTMTGMLRNSTKTNFMTRSLSTPKIRTVIHTRQMKTTIPTVISFLRTPTHDLPPIPLKPMGRRTLEIFRTQYSASTMRAMRQPPNLLNKLTFQKTLNQRTTSLLCPRHRRMMELLR